MSDKKTLLEEGTIRRFMKLANMEALGTGFVNEMYGSPSMKKDETKVDRKDDDMKDDLDETMGNRKDDDMKDDMKDDKVKEGMGHGDMKDDHGGAMQDDDMGVDDLEIEDEEEEMDMDAGDMGELTLTDEEAEVFLKVADKVRAAMEMDAPEEVPAPDMGDMDEPMDEPMDDEPMMDDMVNEVARRVAKRIKGLKRSK